MNYTVLPILKHKTNKTNTLEIKGFNGSGKTTILKYIIRTYYWITIMDINNSILNNIKKESTVIDILNIEKVITYSTLRITNLFYSIGLSKQILKKTYYTLSTGQKKKVLFLLLLIENNFIWYIDEPHNYLDQLTISFFFKQISEHINRGGIILMTQTKKVNTYCKTYNSTISLSRFELLTTRLSSECSTPEL